MNALDIFNPATARWFEHTLGIPTEVQNEAWPVIASGRDTIVSAPTGTGKTLSAFLVFIDRLLDMARKGTLKNELQLIYISPLKSLAGDIRENLRRPLDGITEEDKKSPSEINRKIQELRVAVRTGDTTQSERRKMLKTPPHILITTPESFYLMLTSKPSQSVLRTARWLIIDELHALIDTKRGAHLMLSIARLDKLCNKPVQRVGLSATIRPLEVAAKYLSPERAVIIAPKMHKDIRLEVISPLPAAGDVKKDAVWQEIASSIYQRCQEVRSVIAFVEGRAYAEKLAYYVNKIGGEGYARTHHGSLSKEQRFEVERDLRSGKLRLLCATSSMELGIDVGQIDEVFQIGCPSSVSSTMQRLGRAGHNPNRTSAMCIFTRAPSEGLYSGLASEAARQGGIEYSRPPRLCLDVLAQHLVSMAAGDGYYIDEVMELLPRAYPFSEVTKQDVKDVLCMLAGDYEHGRDIPVRPRLNYDRIHERVEGDPYSRMLAVSAGGTIPDKGMYSVRTEGGVEIGELYEEFVFEVQVGDRFLLGTFAWQITEIRQDTIIVRQAAMGGARMPFWKDEIKGRKLETGFMFGEIFRKLGAANENDTLMDELRGLGLDENAALKARNYIRHQIAITGALPDDRTIIIEHYRDENGTNQMMVHSVFGKPVNEPLAILMTEAAKRIMKTNISFAADDDGFLLFPYEDRPIPEGLFGAVSPENAAEVLSAILPVTTRFNMSFRYNAARALMMGIRKAKRQPLWVQRLRSAEMLDSIAREDSHPLMRETRRECIEDYWDIKGLEQILNRIQDGSIRVYEMNLATPSPMSLQLRYQTEAQMMYDYTPTPSGLYVAVDEALNKTVLIPPSVEQLEKISERTHLPENEVQLHTLMMIEGDLLTGELGIPLEWLETLERREQAIYIEPGLWVAAEHAGEYYSALSGGGNDKEAEEPRLHIIRRLLRYRGALTPRQISDRYAIPEKLAGNLLIQLCLRGEAVEYEGLYYHAKMFDRARTETVKTRRSNVRTQPPERYAALLASHIQTGTPNTQGKERLESVLKSLCGMPYPAELWESVLLPARVRDYRPEMLDNLLAQGKYFWRIEQGTGLNLSFNQSEDIDWEADLSLNGTELEGSEIITFDALLKNGASFVSRLSGLLGGISPLESLMSLVEKGLVGSDSFIPVRNLLNKSKIDGAPVKQKVRSHVSTMTSGRWELIRPVKMLGIEEMIERAFDRNIILCRETGLGMNWAEAVKVLRLWEYTGRARRGYFIEGLPGLQFIREKDYAGTVFALEQPSDSLIWVSAIDPFQPWGKCLAHYPGRSFINVPGTALALRSGIPVALFERQGKILHVYDFDGLDKALSVFAQEFGLKHIYPALRRVTLKEYPPEAEEALTIAGFNKEMRDWVLYR